MICSNCGKEIPENSAYCMYCHAPTAVADDINVNIDILEDDQLLGAFQKEENRVIHEVEISDEKNGPKQKKKLIISLVTFIGVLAICLVSASYINSYTYIIHKADKAYNNGEYDKAYVLYERALEKKGDDVDAMVGAGASAVQIGDLQKGENYLKTALDKDKSNTKAFSTLLDMYNSNGEQDKIAQAGEKYATTSEMKNTLSEVAIDLPVFNVDGGEYDDDIVVGLSSPNNLKIYYTLNGDDPTNGNGTLYEGEIKVTEGTTIIRAACYKKSNFGPIAEHTYIVKYDIPSLASVSPMNGTFDVETTITISSDVKDAKIYYTWDGLNPTQKSTLYTKPIVIPAGNNVLSVIVYAPNGKSSEVLRCNYTYIPSEESLIEQPVSESPNVGEEVDEEETIDSEIESEVVL